MKTLILYATKYGATREIAEKIAEKMGEATLCNLQAERHPAMDEYDCIIVGSPLYAGMVRKEAKAFLKEQADSLCAKPLGLFLSGLDGSTMEAYLAQNVPEGVVMCAKAKAFLGGVFDPKKCGRIEKLLMKMLGKPTAYDNRISEDGIDRFVEEMKG